MIWRRRAKETAAEIDAINLRKKDIIKEDRGWLKGWSYVFKSHNSAMYINDIVES